MSLIRGTPVVLQIYVIYNVTPYLLAELFKKMGSTVNVYQLDPIWYAYLALSLSTTVYLAEALRSGLETVNKGQMEAGLSVGMGRFETFYHVVFPQAFAAHRQCSGGTDQSHLPCLHHGGDGDHGTGQSTGGRSPSLF